MLLTVEYNGMKGAVEIHLDNQGLDLLMERLHKLKKHGGHDHLLTPAWAGNELTEEKQGAENRVINQISIMLWPASHE